jgi:hypothetical protein
VGSRKIATLGQQVETHTLPDSCGTVQLSCLALRVPRVPAHFPEKILMSQRPSRGLRRLHGSVPLALFLLFFAGTCGGDPIYEPIITAAAMVIVAGNGQTAQSGVAVPVAPRVRVSSAGGEGVPNATVVFVVVGGNGTVTGGSGVTGADGTFAVGSWVLGGVGTNTLGATSGSVSVLFTATATAAPSAAITRQAGNN